MKIFASVVLTLILAALSVHALGSDKTEAYFREYFNVKFENTPKSTNEMIVALGGEPIEIGRDGAVDENALIAEGLRMAGLEELALTYTKEEAHEKVNEKLKRAPKIMTGMDASAAAAYAPYLACALDMGLIGPEGLQDIPDFLYRCAEIAGKGRHYLGHVSDENILSVIRSALNSFTNFHAEEMKALGNEIVLRGATTGYSLKYTGYDARFLAEYTFRYGHSDFQHAQQLIGLLRSEGLDAYVQLEPKVSAYEYMLDWGEPAEPTPTYAVVQVKGDRYICYAVEYDLVLEFDTVEDRRAFDLLIETYAKKYDDRVDGDGRATTALLAESWWQPLYFSSAPVNGLNFGELTDNVVYDKTGNFAIHSFSLSENADTIAEVVAEAAPELEVNSQIVYANAAFIRYITGSDYQ